MKLTLLEVFKRAEGFVMEKDRWVVEWSRDALLHRDLTHLTLEGFYADYVWVVMLSGFRWSVIRNKWDDIAWSLFDFDVFEIAEFPSLAKEQLLSVFGNKRKADAVITTAKWLTTISFDEYMKKILQDWHILEELAYIGPVTKYHLAKILGFDVIKPDVHITRITEHFGLDPFEMCRKISEETNYSLHEVDSILWRASEQGVIKLAND